MNTLTIKLPDKVELDLDEVKVFLAAKLYESGKLSLGHAAEIAGYSKVAFAEVLGKYGVSHTNYPPEEINRDVENASSLHWNIRCNC